MKRLSLCLLLLAGCTRPIIRSTDQAMRPTQWPALQDDLNLDSLASGLRANIAMLKENGERTLQFGPRKILAKDYAAALNRLQQALLDDASGEKFRTLLQSDFEIFEVYGQQSWGDVFLTAYYEPVIEGSKQLRPPYTAAVLGVPKDLVEIDVSSFSPIYANAPNAGAIAAGINSGGPQIWRGRLIPAVDKNGTAKVVSLPDRRGISLGQLKAQGEPLAYVDPIDCFFLEIQGSGTIRLKGGEEMAVGYASQNSYPYVPIGRFLLDRIPKEKMSQHLIEAELRKMSREQAQEMMNQNPSYVFFRKRTGGAKSYFGTEAIAGRTIATDGSYFPKGSLAFLQFEAPQFASAQAVEPNAYVPTSRFVLDQDVGGAIRGPGRVDLFWGKGEAARQSAGVMRGRARLFYILPRHS